MPGMDIINIPGFRHWCQVPVNGEEGVRRVIKKRPMSGKPAKKGQGKKGSWRLL